jgi:glycosyltransferase involved in cell wall biosynthesis
MKPDLSIIIPCHNEESSLASLFVSLAEQKGVAFEVVISDGGSNDATRSFAGELAEQHRLPLVLVTGEKGRGRQLNEGVDASHGETLLFLHADSRFVDPQALAKGMESLSGGNDRMITGKYTLRFDRPATPSLAYYFFESKARLVRRECTHGDQGLMMRRDTFLKFGPFEEFPPMLAETRFAEKMRLNGLLLNIPAEILTSTRRFEQEGMFERQTLNAILMNCTSQGWYEPFQAVTDLYRNQSETGRLQLYHVLKTMNRLIAALPDEERRRFWRATGTYVRNNAWQLAFFLDVRINFRKGLPPGIGGTPMLERFDRVVAPKLDCRTCDRITSALVWLWFTVTRLRYRCTK